VGSATVSVALAGVSLASLEKVPVDALLGGTPSRAGGTPALPEQGGRDARAPRAGRAGRPRSPNRAGGTPVLPAPLGVGATLSATAPMLDLPSVSKASLRQRKQSLTITTCPWAWAARQPFREGACTLSVACRLLAAWRFFSRPEQKTTGTRRWLCGRRPAALQLDHYNMFEFKVIHVGAARRYITLARPLLSADQA
jgi:hypothetical protein